MANTQIEAMRLALEALEYMHTEKCDYMRRNKLGDPLREDAARLAIPAITALRTAIEQAEKQEPVAQDVQEKCRIETVPAKGGLLPAAPVQEPLTLRAGAGDCRDAERLCAELNEDQRRYDEAVKLTHQIARVSLSVVMRELGITYNQAAKLFDQMERNGVISPMQPNGKRELREKNGGQA